MRAAQAEAMSPPSASPNITVVRRRDRDEPLDDRRLRSLLAHGTWIKVTAGAFVHAAEWNLLRPIERHRLRVDEVLRRVHGEAVVSHHAAAAVHGIDILGAWPVRVDLSRPPARGGRSSGVVRRHPRTFDSLAMSAYGTHRVTTPAQTALDLARVLPFVEAVAVLDETIRVRAGGALASREDIAGLLESGPPHRGDARARRALAFSDPLAANVRESQSRVLIARLGFPRPRLQERRVLRSGRLVFGDFYWPAHDHWGEFDGRGKYLSPEYGSDTPARRVLAEKDRENEIRREVRGFSRWQIADLDRPVRLYDILIDAGLPSALPRPSGGR